MTRRLRDEAALRELRRIPGIGARISQDLLDLGVRSPDDLKGRDPQRLYQAHCLRQGGPVDRCMLYVFRCAVYFASTKKPKRRLLKWWNWSDEKLQGAA